MTDRNEGVVRSDGEPEFLADPDHAAVGAEDLSDHLLEALLLSHLDEAADHLRAEAMALVVVSDDEAELGGVGVVQADEPRDAGDAELVRLGVEPLSDQGDLTVVVGEADPHEALVGHALLEAILLIGFAFGLQEFLGRETVTTVLAVLGGAFLVWMGGSLLWDAANGHLTLDLEADEPGA